MKEDDVIKFCQESWKWIKDILPNDLEMPYIEINTIKGGYLNFKQSMGDKGPLQIEELEVPTAMCKMDYNSEQGLILAYGGVLLPISCLEDAVEQTQAGLTHEQVHEVLRSKAFIYGLSTLFANDFDTHFIFSNFIEFMAHIYTARTLEKNGFPPKKYYETPVKYTRRIASQQGNHQKEAPPLEKELSLITKQHEDFWAEIKEYDPIIQFNQCFEKFLEAYARRDLAVNCKVAYDYVSKMKKTIIRRNYQNKWGSIKPII